MKLSEMQVKVMCCDVRMRSVFFFPLESNSDFPQHDWCKHQYTHFYCYSLWQHKGHTWRGERRREESNQPKCIHITHAHHTHITCGANELKRFTDLSSRRKWSENRRRTTVKWWSRDIVSTASMSFVATGIFQYLCCQEARTFDLCTVVEGSKLMRFYGQGALFYVPMLRV